MSVTTHVEELRKKHATLSQQVEHAQRSPGYDELRISEMKRRKLRLKEEIERLATH